MAPAWSYEHILRSFTTSKPARALAPAFARLTAFWWKYLEYCLVDKPGTPDAAAGHYLRGRKGDRILSDRELIALYRGESFTAPDPL